MSLPYFSFRVNNVTCTHIIIAIYFSSLYDQVHEVRRTVKTPLASVNTHVQTSMLYARAIQSVKAVLFANFIWEDVGVFECLFSFKSNQKVQMIFNRWQGA